MPLFYKSGTNDIQGRSRHPDKRSRICIPNIGHSGCLWAAIENFVVEEACRGRGIGTKLMEAATKLCQEYGCYKIVLSSNLARQQSHEFYRHLGWQQSHIGFSIAVPQEAAGSSGAKRPEKV